MKAKPNSASKRSAGDTDALRALKRAAKNAVELARRTGTPAWVMVDGKMVDAAKRPRREKKKRRE